MPYAKRSAPSLPSLRTHLRIPVAQWLGLAQSLPPLLRVSPPLLAPFQCYHHPFYVLLRAAVNMNIWIMSLISMFPPLSLFLSLTWWLLGGGGGVCRRCRRAPTLPLPPPRPAPPMSRVGGGGSNMGESSFPLVISTAEAAVRGGRPTSLLLTPPLSLSTSTS